MTVTIHPAAVIPLVPYPGATSDYWRYPQLSRVGAARWGNGYVTMGKSSPNEDYRNDWVELLYFEVVNNAPVLVARSQRWQIPGVSSCEDMVAIDDNRLLLLFYVNRSYPTGAEGERKTIYETVVIQRSGATFTVGTPFPVAEALMADATNFIQTVADLDNATAGRYYYVDYSITAEVLPSGTVQVVTSLPSFPPTGDYQYQLARRRLTVSGTSIAAGNWLLSPIVGPDSDIYADALQASCVLSDGTMLCLTMEGHNHSNTTPMNVRAVAPDGSWGDRSHLTDLANYGYMRLSSRGTQARAALFDYEGGAKSYGRLYFADLDAAGLPSNEGWVDNDYEGDYFDAGYDQPYEATDLTADGSVLVSAGGSLELLITLVGPTGTVEWTRLSTPQDSNGGFAYSVSSNATWQVLKGGAQAMLVGGGVQNAPDSLVGFVADVGTPPPVVLPFVIRGTRARFGSF